jgi:hypothetical protein
MDWRINVQVTSHSGLTLLDRVILLSVLVLYEMTIVLGRLNFIAVKTLTRMSFPCYRKPLVIVWVRLEPPCLRGLWGCFKGCRSHRLLSALGVLLRCRRYGGDVFK